MAKPTIICVDDELTILKSLKGQLKRFLNNEYTIETVESGEEALELYDELVEDEIEVPLVISDQIMPNMKGDDLLISLRRKNPGILLILLTGQASADAVGNAVNQANLYRYIAKPWEEKDLTLTVKEAIRRYYQEKQLEEQTISMQQMNRELEEVNTTLKTAQSRLLQLNEISKYVGATLELQQVATKFIEQAVQSIRPDGSGSVLILNDRRNTLVFYAHYGLAPEYVRVFEIEISPETLYSYDVFTDQQGKVLNHEELAPFQTEETKKLHYGREYYQQIVMPLVAQNKSIGLVTVSHYTSDIPFTDSDFHLLDSITKALSNHFENSRLYTQVTELNTAYQRFVPHEFLNILNKESILDVELGDQIQKTMSVLFSDIRSFTTLSETMTPEENFKFINSYLNKMGPLVRENYGFIDKFIGDSIMALFNRQPEDPIQTAITMLHLLRRYNEGRKRAGYIPISIGIGVNTGLLMMGTLGEKDRMEGTVISDAVNLASRLEGLTKVYKTPLLISEYTLESLKDPSQFAHRFIDRVKVKGKDKPVKIYEVFDADPPGLKSLKLLTLDHFEKGSRAYHEGDPTTAKQFFKKCIQLNPEDTVVQYYLERCQEN